MLTYEEMFPTDLGRRHVMKSRCIYFNNDGVVAVAEYNGYKHSLHSSVIRKLYKNEFRDGIYVKDGKVILHYNLVDVEIISDWCSYVAKLKFVKEETV